MLKSFSEFSRIFIISNERQSLYLNLLGFLLCFCINYPFDNKAKQISFFNVKVGQVT